MVGFDVGATTITHSTGLHMPLEMRVPQDLTMRVAQNRPCITTVEGELVLHEPHTLYAEAVAEAIHHHTHDPHSETTLAVPGWWAPSTVDQVQQALVARGLSVHTVNEAEAAVAEQQLTTPNLPESVVVVSLRAAHSSAVIVQQCDARPRALMSPTLVIEEGGNHLDAAVLRHLVSGLNELGSAVDTTDPSTITAALPALSQCRDIRERLSYTTTESVDLMLPGAIHRARLVRSELEEVTGPWVDSVVRTVIEALELSGRPVGAVLLTGGLASMPLVSQRLSAELGVEVIAPAEPRLIAARGAARLLANDSPAPHRWRDRFSLSRFARRTPRVPRTAKAPRLGLVAPVSPVLAHSAPLQEAAPQKAPAQNNDATDEFFEAMFAAAPETEPAGVRS